jgi:hypothetical protein
VTTAGKVPEKWVIGVVEAVGAGHGFRTRRQSRE